MRWYRILVADKGTMAFERDGVLVPTSATSLDDVIAGGFEELGEPLPVEQAALLAPFQPRKIIAVGLNYADHCREAGFETPKSPVIFAKYLNTVADPGASISWPAGTTEKVDFEAELGVVIGRSVKGVDVEAGGKAIFGYVAVNDLSARDIQSGDGQWVRGKSLDGFCPFGPALVTSDEIPDPQALDIRCLVNGVAYQNSSTAEMIFPCDFLVSFLSRTMRLDPGDLILTGTPHGVGNFWDPPVYLKAGDEVVVEIEGIGRLVNTVAGPL